MKKGIIAFMTGTAMLALMAGCKESGEEFTITVRNLTGVEISQIYITHEVGSTNKTNYLEENLPANQERELELGQLTAEDTNRGFDIVVYNAEDNSSGTFSMLTLKSGDTVSFYMDDWGLAAAVNTSDEEIAEMIEIEHEENMAATYTTE